MTAALEEEKLPIGVFYVKEGVPSYEEADPSIAKHGSPVKQKLGLTPQEAEALKASFR